MWRNEAAFIRRFEYRKPIKADIGSDEVKEKAHKAQFCTLL